MKTLLIYASKSGATKECAELIASKVPDTTLCDIQKQTPDIAAYDTIVLASGVRMGKMYKSIRKFMKKNVEALTEKRHAVYLCNADPNSFEKALTGVPPEIKNSAIILLSFGGKQPFSKEEGADQNWMNAEAVAQFIEAL